MVQDLAASTGSAEWSGLSSPYTPSLDAAPTCSARLQHYSAEATPLTVVRVAATGTDVVGSAQPLPRLKGLRERIAPQLLA